jgi:hypothetical protein
MSSNKILLAILTLPIILLSFARPAFAVNVPNFGSCPSISGTQIASYPTGTHAVAGSQTYTGSDTVYQVADNGFTQCLCVDNGQGIQTNWLKTTGMSDTDIQTLKGQGWIDIGNGSSWGLGDFSYLANNSHYACHGESNNTQVSCTPTPTETITPSVTETPAPSEIETPTPTATDTPAPTETPGPTATPTPGSSNSTSSSEAPTPTPAPASNSTAVTLASTGNSFFIYAVVLTGAASLISGMILKKLSK